MFAPPPDITTEIYARLPDTLRIHGKHTPWSRPRGSGPLHSFLEGPAFDRSGRFWCVDVNHGRIFRITDGDRWEVFAEYEGNPNGLKIHRDGRIFVADHRLGILSFDPDTGARTLVADGFRGPNDLVFSDNGDLYFTDPGESSLDDPHGRVFRLSPDGRLDVLAERLPYPNGLVLNEAQTALYVAMSRSLQVVRMPLLDGRVYKSGVFIQLSGGHAGPDGMALAEDGGLVVVHAGFGTVWVFDRFGEPIGRVRSCAGIRTTNVTFDPDDRSLIYVTEAEDGVILKARLGMTGRRLFSHA